MIKFTSFLTGLALSAAAFGAEPPLPAALQASRSSLAAIDAAAREAQFVVVGEDHGVVESAAFVGSLLVPLARAGYAAMAIETGPAVGEAVAKALRQPDPLASLGAFNRRYPDSLAFYNWAEDAAVLRDVARAAGPQFAVWGIDQEPMGASGFVLEDAGPPALREKEHAARDKALASGNPTDHFMMTASDEDLAAFPGLAESRSIYRKGMDGRGFESNAQRAALMKRQLARHLDKAPASKLLVKIGASHAYKGINNLGGRDLGNYLAERAEGQGQRSLHVIVLPAKGQQLRFAGSGRPFMAASVQPYTAGAAPLFAAAQGAESPVVFDLRGLRPRARDLAGPDIELLHLLQGFDFAVILPDAHPMHELP